MSRPVVSIILDSISSDGVRLTTFQLRYWRGIHSELMTHRVFSRNAGSSRARPSKAIIEQVREKPWGPIHWGANQAGMQAHQELDGVALQEAKHIWEMSAINAANTASMLLDRGVHKQIVNRLLEPFTYIDAVVTATDYANWFALRDHPDAQPEIQELARMMREAYTNSTPQLLQLGEWHLPYINNDVDSVAAYNYCKKGRLTRDEPNHEEILTILRKISVARCARVSYKAFDGTHSPIEKDIELFDKLLSSQPLHASPAEHQAEADTMIFPEWDIEHRCSPDEMVWARPELHGNFRGWCQYRKMLPNEYVPG